MSEASGIPAWCRVGVKVVHVRDASEPFAHNFKQCQYPVLGQVYTVRDVRSRTILLKEIRNDPLPWRVEPGFNFAHFRPAVPPKTQSEDVGLFRHHLDDVRADA